MCVWTNKIKWAFFRNETYMGEKEQRKEGGEGGGFYKEFLSVATTES